MKKLPTAEELILKTGSYEFWDNFYVVKEEIKDAMIEFAKLHVEAALKKASKKAEIIDVGIDYAIMEFVVDKSSILNSYPLENIK